MTTADTTKDKLTITIFDRKNLPAFRDNIDNRRHIKLQTTCTLFYPYDKELREGRKEGRKGRKDNDYIE